jgi:hypothetical protein
MAELSPGIDRTVLASAARQIVLFHLDRAWAEHLAFLADLREGIHLRALARGTVPLNEFNREAIRAFGNLLEEAEARSAETFRTAAITPDGVDLEAIGLKRPTSTWTYLVHENPFGTDIDRALRSIARRIRKTRTYRRLCAGKIGGGDWAARRQSAQLCVGRTGLLAVSIHAAEHRWAGSSWADRVVDARLATGAAPRDGGTPWGQVRPSRGDRRRGH